MHASSLSICALHLRGMEPGALFLAPLLAVQLSTSSTAGAASHLKGVASMQM